MLLKGTDERTFGIEMDGHCTFMNRAPVSTPGWGTEMVLVRKIHEPVRHAHRTAPQRMAAGGSVRRVIGPTSTPCGVACVVALALSDRFRSHKTWPPQHAPNAAGSV